MNDNPRPRQPAPVAAERIRWNDKYLAQRGATNVNARLEAHRALLRRGRLLDLAGGTGQNAARLLALEPDAWQPVVCDLSDEALRRAPSKLPRVLAQADALPFASSLFDTVLCIRFYDPQVHLDELLVPGGTLFFETFTTADARYRPEFDPTHRFDPADAPYVFRGLDLVFFQESDDGRRIYATVIARKPSE